jgi:hypothetical protein
MEPFDAILRFLADVRRALGRVALGEAVFATSTLLGLAALLALALANGLGLGDGRWGWALGLAGLVAAGLAVRVLLVRPTRARRDDAALALWVEAKAPAFGSALVSAVEAGRLKRQGGETAALGFSPALADETASLAGALVRRVDIRGLPDRTRLQRLQLGALCTLALMVGLGVAAPDFYTEGAHHLTSAGPADEEGEDRLVDVAVSQLDVEVVAPAYAGLKPRPMARSAGDIEALAGSEVRFEATALYPASGAALVLESDPEARWMLNLERDGTLKGQFKVGKDDRYQFVLMGADGEVLRERTWRQVQVRPDLPPEMTLLLPENDLEVKPNDQIGFFYEASDDLGLDRVELVVVDGDGKELVRKAVSESAGSKLEKDDATVDVAALGLDPGDSAEVYFEGIDRNDVSGPGIGKSVARRLTLYSPADEHDRLLQALRQLLESMLDVLANRLESEVSRDRPDLVATFADTHLGISNATAAVLETMEGLIAAVSTDALATDELRTALREVRDELQAIHTQERAHIDKWVEDRDLVEPRVLVTLLAQSNDEAVTSLETGILRLKKLIDGALKEAILEAGREMMDTQNEMMELLKQLKDNNDPAAREAAMRKLKKLQEKLKELQQKLARLQERSPYENQNAAQRPSERQEEAKSLESQMAQIQKLLEEGKVEEAMKLLEELSKSTQEMMAGLSDDLQNIGGAGASSEARRQMTEMKQSLDELADGQRGLQRETGETGDAIDERQGKALMEKAQEELGEMRAEAKQLREELGKVPEKSLATEDKKALEELERAADRLEQALEKTRLEEAEKESNQVCDGAGKLSKEVGESEARESNEQRLSDLRDAMKGLDEAKVMAEKLAERMGKLRPKPGEGLSEGESKRMGELGKSQEQLGERLEQLKQRLEQLDKEMPGLKDAMQQSLDGAGQAMGEAKKELGDKRASSAKQKQQEALEKLQEAQQQLNEQMQKQQQQGGDNDETTGVNDPKAKVGIPKDDPNAKARNLRAEIIKAMQEKAPEQYKEVIRRFYEELTK